MAEKKLTVLEIKANDYRNLFSSRTGRRVLADLLTQNYFFSEIKNDEERVRRNMAIKILEDMGVLQEKTIKPITDALVNIAKKYPIIIKGEKHGY